MIAQMPHRNCRRSKRVVPCLAILGMFGGSGFAIEDTQLTGSGQQDEALLEVFTGPVATKLRPPNYPHTQMRRDQEGWVNVHFMVSSEGKPYALTVTDSIGDASFEGAALSAIRGWRFEPAVLNGEPVEAGSQYKVTFALGGNAGVSRKFRRNYKKLSEAINNRNKEAADTILNSLEVQRLYEDASLHMAKFAYYQVWGTKSQQLAALQRSIAYEDNANYLPRGIFRQALLAAFKLEVELQDYATALTTWGKLQRQDLDEALVATLQKSAEGIQQLKDDDRAYAIKGTFGSRTSWSYPLLKDSFQVHVETGKVDEIKLRCAKNYVFFRYDPELQYDMSANSGLCNLELIGDPGTIVRLIQL